MRDFIPDAQITFDDEDGIEESDIYLVDNSRIREEFEVELPPFRQRVLGYHQRGTTVGGDAPCKRIATRSIPLGYTLYVRV